MIDAVQFARQWLLASSAVQAFLIEFGDGGYPVFGEVLPEHFDPTSNPAIVVSRKGGLPHAEIAALIDSDVQVRVWAGVNQFALAASLYAAVYDTMHSQSMVTFAGYGTALNSVASDEGQSIVDEDSGWATMIGHFHILLRQDQSSTLPTWIDDTQTIQEYIDSYVTLIDGGEPGENFS